MNKLLKLAKLLRDPEKGCPWDLAQTFDSFKNNILEESKEVIEAIEKKDFENLKEELGDTLFNIIFLINLAEEKNIFKLEDVIEGIYNKMIIRHPHVFGNKEAKTVEEAYNIFQEQKKQH